MQIRNPFDGNVKVGEGNAIVSLQLSYKFLQLLVWVNHLQVPISKIISLKNISNMSNMTPFNLLNLFSDSIRSKFI